MFTTKMMNLNKKIDLILRRRWDKSYSHGYRLSNLIIKKITLRPLTPAPFENYIISVMLI